MYKIINIQHTGTFGERGTKRREAPYLKRIGRTVTDELVNSSKPGNQLILQYVTDENGNDYSDKFLCCSKLVNKSIQGDEVFLETRNSIYVLEKIKEKKLFCIIGRTSSGKTSLTKEVAKQLNLKVVKSYTTRPLRPGEIETESDHYFISEEEYPNYKNDIVAYTEINGYRYFTTNKELNDADLYVIDPKGYYMLLFKVYVDKILSGVPPVPIYIALDHDIARQRAASRGDVLEDWDERYQSEDAQFKDFENFISVKKGYVINNDSGFKCAVETMKNIILKEQGS